MNKVKSVAITTVIFAMATAVFASTAVATETTEAAAAAAVKAAIQKQQQAVAAAAAAAAKAAGDQAPGPGWCGYQPNLPASQGYVDEGKVIYSTIGVNCSNVSIGYNYIVDTIGLAPNGCAYAGTPSEKSIQICHTLYTTFLHKKAPYSI